MKFWHDYMERRPFLAAAWMRLAQFQLYGEVRP